VRGIACTTPEAAEAAARETRLAGGWWSRARSTPGGRGKGTVYADEGDDQQGHGRRRQRW